MKFRSSPIAIKLDETSTSSPTDNAQVPSDVQVMRTGTYYSDQYGKFEITKEVLLSLANNYKKNVRGVDLAIDYKHDSEDIAAGWIKDVYLKNNGTELWAKVQWTPNGQKVLSDKEFRYLSADFDFNYQHNETKEKHGPTLYGAGLTNRPFIKNMTPVVELSEKEGNTMDPKDQKIAELEAKIAELTKQVEELNKTESNESDDTSSPDGQSQEMADLKKKNQEMEAKLAEYEAKEKAAQEEKKLAEKTNSFNKLLSEGKAVEAQRDAFMKDDTVRFAENAQAVNLQGKGSSEEPAHTVSDENVQKQIIELAEKAVQENKLKTLGEGIAFVLRNNSDLRAKYEGK